MLNLTKQEQGIVLFLAFALAVGSAVTLYNRFFAQHKLPEVEPQLVQQFIQRSNEIRAGADTLTQSEQVNLSGVYTSLPTHTESIENREQLRDKFLIDINSADETELQKLPRIGPVIARRIVQYRERHGPFRRLEDLDQVKGIGQATLERIQPYVAVN